MRRNDNNGVSRGARKAFTLVEILISISILSILIVGFISLMGSSINIFSANKRAYEVQSDVLYASNTLTEAVRDSTVVFILSNAKYNPDKITEENIEKQNNSSDLGLTPGWNYIGSNSDKTILYNFVWDEDAKKHIPFEMTIGQKDDPTRRIEYTLEMSLEIDNIRKEIEKYKTLASLTEEQKKELKKLTERLEKEANILRYSILGRVISPTNAGIQQTRHQEYKSESMVFAVNVKQIMDHRKGQPATAIAYSTKRIISKTGKVDIKRPVVAVVLDFSGSMWSDMNGYSTNKPEDRRVSILKAEFEKLLGKFETIGGVDLYVIPFSRCAFAEDIGSTGAIKELKDKQDKGSLKIFSDSSSDTGWIKEMMNKLNPNGGTNYGNGVNIGLQYLNNSKASRTYLLVLSDGAPNMYTDPLGNHHWDAHNRAMNYIKESAESASSSLKVVHLIGFSNKQSDNSRLEEIKTYFDPIVGKEKVKVYKAGNAVELDFAFQSFTGELEKDLWYFEGP